MDGRPFLYVFGGSNGAGKTTYARAYLGSRPKPVRFLNADEIARGLSPFAPESVAVQAGRLLISEFGACVRKGESFAIESTLSGHSQARMIQSAKLAGFRVELHYVWLPSAAMAIQRVANRVSRGGHHVPDEDVRRRYDRSMENFLNVYLPLADHWELWQNAEEKFVPMANSIEHDAAYVRSEVFRMNASTLQEPTASPRRELTDAEAKRRQEMLAAAELMAKQVREEHRRWGHKLVLWKNGQIVYEDP